MKASGTGKHIVATEQTRQAHRSWNVGKGEFQARQSIAPNKDPKSPSMIEKIMSESSASISSLEHEYFRSHFNVGDLPVSLYFRRVRCQRT